MKFKSLDYSFGFSFVLRDQNVWGWEDTRNALLNVNTWRSRKDSFILVRNLSRKPQFQKSQRKEASKYAILEKIRRQKWIFLFFCCILVHGNILLFHLRRKEGSLIFSFKTGVRLSYFILRRGYIYLLQKIIHGEWKNWFFFLVFKKQKMTISLSTNLNYNIKEKIKKKPKNTSKLVFQMVCACNSFFA